MTGEPFQRVDPKGAKELIESEGATIIDVRTIGEFESGHIPGSYNIPIAHGTPPALQPNPEFLSAMTSRFANDAKLVFV